MAQPGEHASGAPRGAPSVRRVGEGVPYLDGAEARLLEVMLTSTDRSSGSDELDDEIVDWPSRYHLSHQRSNLLRPLTITPGTRVLDVGAGTGSLARYLGEQGASVVALEGNMARAEVAAARCADLSNVEVLCGSIDDLDPSDQFDLITVIGVLEYSAAAIGGAAGPAHLLNAVRGRLRPHGAMALAIENQLGLKYLLGGAEDHRGVPWVGLEDYPGPPGARTWSRRVLSDMLRAAGFDAQRWLFPFPDYKLPTIVLHEQLFAATDHEELIEQLVLRPVTFPDATPVRLADAAAALGVLVRAGLGEDVASSFLVIAARDPDGVETVVDDDVLAWIDGNQRRSPWRRHRVLTTDRDLVVRAAGSGQGPTWLQQEAGGTRRFESGRTLGQQVQAHLRAHDTAGVADVLRRWWQQLQMRATPAPDDLDDAVGRHPFLRRETVEVLPDGYLDVSPSNFVDREGALLLIDDEWRVGGPVDLHLVVIRALWVLSREVVTSGISHPWGDLAAVKEVFDSLCAMIDLTVSDEAMAAFEAAEVELQQIVSGGDEAHLRAGWLSGVDRGVDHRPDRRLAHEVEGLRTGLVASQEEARQLQATVSELERQRAELVGQVQHYTGLLEASEARIAYLRTGRGFARAALGRVTRTLRRRA
ncbi:MAG: class I SAM-dependent methyltransferase [Microthrixaceae bacterium]